MKKKHTVLLFVTLFVVVLYFTTKTYLNFEDATSFQGKFVKEKRQQNQDEFSDEAAVKKTKRNGKKRHQFSRQAKQGILNNLAKSLEKSRPTSSILEEIDREVAEEWTKIVGDVKYLVPKKSIEKSRTLQEAGSFKGVVLEKALQSLPTEGGKRFPRDYPCPYFGLRKVSRKLHKSLNISCLRHKPNIRDCILANSVYKIRKKRPKCAEKKPVKDLCAFRETWRSSSKMLTRVRCDFSPCGESLVHVIPIDNDFGILASMDKWLEFSTTKSLEDFLPDFVAKNSVFGLQFCFLRCRKRGSHKFIKQILSFPPIMSNPKKPFDRKLFNLNFVVLNSVSRAHFYRSLPRTVKTMREIVHDASKEATVLDFEMLQSTAPFRFHNIKGFMSGKKGFEFEEKQDYGIASLYGLLKSKGYYTMLQDDSCWYDEWGSLFTNHVYRNATPSTLLEFSQQWDSLTSAVANYHIDDMGLSNTACDAYKQYKSTNQEQKHRICFSGKPYAEHFLNYTTNLLRAFRHSGKKSPIFAFTQLGVGQEVSGTRIRQIDDSLAHYVRTFAKDQDTLTVIFSDHGPKSSQYALHTMQGRAEMYDAMLFVVLPKNVAEKLKIQKTRALIANQKRLITTIDLHKAVLSIVDPAKLDGKHGIFSEVSAQRTCNDLTMKSSAVCKCSNWYKMYADNHKEFKWLAELGLGEINNAIQEEYLTENMGSGYRRCQRLVGHSFWKIRHRVEEGKQVVTMDIIVKPNMEIFEVQVKFPEKPRGGPRDQVKVSALRRVSLFNIYKQCHDPQVPLDLCVCNANKRQQRRAWDWTDGSSKANIMKIIRRGTSFGSKLSIKNLHGNCLLLLLRKHNKRTEVYEIANVCADRKYKIRMTGKSKSKSITSRHLPLAKVVQPLTMHFLFSVYHLKKPYGLYLKASYRWKTVVL